MHERLVFWHYICWYSYTEEVKRYLLMHYNTVVGLFNWLWCVWMVFNIIFRLLVNHIFFLFLWFTDWLMIGVSMKPWTKTWFKLDSFINSSYHSHKYVLSTLCGNRWQPLSISFTHIYVAYAVFKVSLSDQISWNIAALKSITGNVS